MAGSSHGALVVGVGAFDLRCQSEMSNIYLELTNQFNEGKLRAVLSLDQAMLLHGIGLGSWGGDWIVREDAQSLDHILKVLEDYGAQYRMGAPLDARWMQGGWSAHFEFTRANYRARTDFVTRPPRVAPEDLAQMWEEQENQTEFPVPTIDLRRLALLKLTQRERDYPFIGEIARRLPSLREQLLWSRSARDLIDLADEQPDLTAQLATTRPLLYQISQGRDVLEVALDAERRASARTDEIRLSLYTKAAIEWTRNWPALKREISGLPLRQAHQIVVERAQILPTEVL